MRGKGSFTGSLSDHFRRWGADTEQRERRERAEQLARTEHALQTDFDLAEERWQHAENSFRQMLQLIPKDCLPAELDGFSVKGSALLPKTILYFSSLGLMRAKGIILPPGEMLHGTAVNRAASLLGALCRAHPALLSENTKLKDAPFYPGEGRLSRDFCGDFWRACIRAEKARREAEKSRYGEYESDAVLYSLESGIEELLYIRDILSGEEADREDETAELLDAWKYHLERV